VNIQEAKLSIVPRFFVVRSYPEKVKTYQKILNANGEFVSVNETECYRIIARDDFGLYYIYFEDNGMDLIPNQKIKVRKLLGKTIIEVVKC
jgi:hypothetical protein